MEYIYLIMTIKCWLPDLKRTASLEIYRLHAVLEESPVSLIEAEFKFEGGRGAETKRKPSLETYQVSGYEGELNGLWNVKDGSMITGGAGAVKGQTTFSVVGRVTARSPLWKVYPSLYSNPHTDRHHKSRQMGGQKSQPFFILEVTAPSSNGLPMLPCLRIVFQGSICLRVHSLLMVDRLYLFTGLVRSLLFKGTPSEVTSSVRVRITNKRGVIAYSYLI